MNVVIPPKAMTTEPVLDRLLPMHIRFTADGIVGHTGPTMRKMMGQNVEGRSVFDVISVRRPIGVSGVGELLACNGGRLSISLSAAPDIALRATLVELPEAGGGILDVSLGLSFVTAVAEFDLTLQDFSPNDQTVELLYLHEANTATSHLSRQLTQRLQSLHAAAEYQAKTDPLTGLSNRRAIDRDLDRLLADQREDFAVLQVDLDLFKSVNDTLGHAAGDAVLVEVGRILSSEIRRNDRSARVGGDEFLIVLRDNADLDVAAKISRRLIDRIERPIFFEGTPCSISASIGFASTAQYLERPKRDAFLADIDAALYAAKHAGRGRFMAHGADIEDRRK